MKIRYDFENEFIYITYINDQGIATQEDTWEIHNALSVLQKMIDVPQIKIIYDERAVD